MPAKWIGFLVFIWIIAAILGGISEGGTVLGENTTEYATVNDLLVYTEVISEESWGSLVSPGTHARFFGAIFKLLTLDFPFWNDYPYSIAKWIIAGPIIATLVFGLILLFFSIVQRTLS